MPNNRAEREKRTYKENERRANRRKNAEVADWINADAQLLQHAIAAVAADGGAVRLGYTSDGGAYAIGIYGDGEPYTDYVRPSEDINEYLKNLYRDYTKD